MASPRSLVVLQLHTEHPPWRCFRLSIPAPSWCLCSV